MSSHRTRDTSQDPTDVNRASWDARARVHGQDAYYDTAGLVAGSSSLLEAEEAGLRRAVGDVRGRDVLHVQCHLGFDAVTLARRGACVTGADFSPASVARAREIAARCGVDVTYVEADATDLPTSLHGRFDLAYATVGILMWIADVDAWMRSVAATLRPGGALLLLDLHPLAVMVDSTDPLVIDAPYGFDGAHVYEEPHSYADPDAVLDATTTVQYSHGLGEIVTAAVGAGLALERLDEYEDADSDVGGLVREEDGRYRLRVAGAALPVLYGLVARRPVRR